MAEIHVEQKRRAVWPWIAGGLLAMVAVWALFDWGGVREPMVTEVTPVTDTFPVAAATPMAADAPAAVNELVRFSETPIAADAADRSHQRTADGLRKVADAIDAVTERTAVSGVEVAPRVAEIRDKASALENQTASAEHALRAREAFIVAGSLLIRVQEARSAGAADQVREVNSAAEAIDASRPLPDQTAAIDRFFKSAASALLEIARSG